MKPINILKNWKACLGTWIILFIIWGSLIALGLRWLAGSMGYLFLLANIWVLFQIIFQLKQKRWKEAFISFVVPLLLFIIGLPAAIIFSINMEDNNQNSEWEFPENVTHQNPIPIDIEDTGQKLSSSSQFHEVLDSLKLEFKQSDEPYSLKIIASQKQGNYRYLFFNKDPRLKKGHLNLKGFEYTTGTKVFNGDNFVKIQPYSENESEVDWHLSRKFWIHESNYNKPLMVRCELWFNQYGGRAGGHTLFTENYKMKGWFRDYH